MKYVVSLALLATMACNSSKSTADGTSQTSTSEASAVSADPVAYAETITEADLKEHLNIYASDEFEGRETGEPGQKKAVEYLKTEYEKLGIPPAQENGDYFQKVPLEVSKVPTGSITVNGQEFPLGESLLTFSKVQGNYDELVYVGYGIEDGDYSDYKGLDVEGKAILVKTGEPKDENGNYLLSGSGEKSIWSNMSESLGKRFELAKSKGAAVVFYYDEGNFGRFQARFNYMQNNDSGQMQLAADSSGDFVNLFVDKNLAETLIPDIASKDTPEAIATDLAIDIKSENDGVDSENVVAIIKGSEKPEEFVVISSHLDHIGVTPDGRINNGADDDGSGTVALLEIAEAFKKAADAGQGPKRSIVFLHVTGEEKGLLGSRYYTDIDPVVPLENTVADLNIDMIGRIDPTHEGNRNYIYLIGSDKLSTDLHELSEAINDKYANIELDYKFNDENDPNRFYYRSDHYNFAKNNIPIIFYFSGTHADYHKPTDTVDKINFDLLENRTRLVFHTAWEVANREQRVVVDKASK